jgi:hypothetical protein
MHRLLHPFAAQRTRQLERDQRAHAVAEDRERSVEMCADAIE